MSRTRRVGSVALDVDELATSLERGGRSTGTARRLPLRLRRLIVDLTPMSHMQHVDATVLDVYAIDNAVVAHANPSESSPRSGQGRPRVRGAG